ncbi:hypothetical protein PACTADRAFT_51279 [Pachysolen tannophilus NRRL Y-2460]|uniref:Origin recognition complex subunit 1 n=1 Tax=Pachysolen tannophilus NRRL Y-2460 TaxID=669874 RepID=A0A1E4TRQ6_PACTA|nr:hypothetical protein PACTADRAFT_51279 [Pachysolen tannophilus NRRL Y-2460]
MSKSQNQFKGWQYILDAPETKEGGERRALRRNAEDVKLILKRDEDGLELKNGDCILVNQENDVPDIAYIKEIRFGTDDFLEIRIMWFIRIKDVEIEDLAKYGESKDAINGNEVFITAVQDKVYIDEIIDKCKVLSLNDFNSITIDESNMDNTFVCKRACDGPAEVFTEIIDWADLHGKSITNSDEFLQIIRAMTVAPTLKIRASSSLKQQKQKKAEPVKQKAEKGKQETGNSKIITVYQSDSENDNSENDVDDDDEEEEEEFYSGDESDLDFKKTKKIKPSTKSLTKKTRKTPWRKKNRKTPKTKRITSTTDLPSLPKRRLNLNFSSDEDDESHADDNKRLFKKAKRRLHLSTRLNSLPCRENEFKEIYTNLEEAINSEVGTCIYISGTPGTGKTATVREVVKQLANEYNDNGDENDDDDDKFDYLEINGLKLLTPASAYEVLWEKISGQRISAVNAALLLEDYFQKNGKNRKPLVILMDELDQIVTRNQAVMYNFFNWPSYSTSKLVVIAVANTMDLPERMLSNKISSRLGLTRIQFPGYNFKELTTIITHRLQNLEKLNQGKLIIRQDAIEIAARKVASVSGDARRALTICRRAVELAEWNYYNERKKAQDEEDEEEDKRVYTVQIQHIMKAVNETTNSPIAQYLNALSTVSKVFLICLLLRKKRSGLAENSMGDVIDEINNNLIRLQSNSKLNKDLKANNLDLVRLFFGKDGKDLRIQGFNFVVQELVESGILLQQNVRAERLGLLKLNISDDEVVNVFKKDDYLKGLLIF